MNSINKPIKFCKCFMQTFINPENKQSRTILIASLEDFNTSICFDLWHFFKTHMCKSCLIIVALLGVLIFVCRPKWIIMDNTI